MQVSIDITAFKGYKKSLEGIHRSAFPRAIRSTLNSAAFDVKQNTMPQSAKNTFTQRKANFFKANSRVDMAKGNDVNSMRAMVGFMGKQQAVQDLEQQEHGGKIGGRSFIPMDTARTGKNNAKMIKSANLLKKVPKIINAQKVRFKGSKRKASQRYIRAVFAAKKTGALVLGNMNGGKQVLSRIDQLSSDMKSRKLIIKRTPLYTFVKNRSVKVKPTEFMKRASFESGAKIDDYFMKHARVEFDRYFNK